MRGSPCLSGGEIRWRQARDSQTVTHPSRQRGAFLMARALMVVGILTAMLVIPVYLKKEREQREQDVRQREVAASQGPGVAAAGAASAGASTPEGSAIAPRSIGHGLTLAVVGNRAAPADGVVRLACAGEPAPTDQPLYGACHPGAGDTSCRAVLPVLCIRPGGAPAPAAATVPPGEWTGGTLGATQPVMGAVLESAAMADARCEHELGAGWRMAGLHDAAAGQSGAAGLQGQLGAGLTGYTRYWVQSRDQKANCWDSGS